MRTHLIILLLALTVAACLAEAPTRFQRVRQRQQPQQLRRRPVNRFQRLQVPARTRYFARQEASPTPYPTAEELKPTAQPELVYGPPDQLYGPPADELPAAGPTQEFAPNPEAEEFAVQVPTAQPAPARLSSLQQRRRPIQQVQAQRLAKLQTLESVQPQTPLVQPLPNVATYTVAAAAPLAVPAPAPLTTIPAQQYFVLNQPFAYTAQFQAW